MSNAPLINALITVCRVCSICLGRRPLPRPDPLRPGRLITQRTDGAVAHDQFVAREDFVSRTSRDAAAEPSHRREAKVRAIRSFPRMRSQSRREIHGRLLGTSGPSRHPRRRKGRRFSFLSAASTRPAADHAAAGSIRSLKSDTSSIVCVAMGATMYPPCRKKAGL